MVYVVKCIFSDTFLWLQTSTAHHFYTSWVRKKLYTLKESPITHCMKQDWKDFQSLKAAPDLEMQVIIETWNMIDNFVAKLGYFHNFLKIAQTCSDLLDLNWTWKDLHRVFFVMQDDIVEIVLKKETFTSLLRLAHI